MTDILDNPYAANEPNVGDQERKLSMLGGGLMLLAGLRWIKSPIGWSALALGAGMLSRGVTGKCAVYQGMGVNTHESEKEGFVGRATVTIYRPVEEIYAYWRNFENLPRVMSHLIAVTETDDKHSTWMAKAPLGQTVSWDAILTKDEENQALAWESLPDADVRNAGHIEFVPLSNDRGTEIHVHLRYFPPAGAVGAGIAKLFGEDPQKQIEDDLLRFKQFMETGENAVTAGQSAAANGKRRLKSNIFSSATASE